MATAKKTTKKDLVQYRGLGRRKSSTARVILRPGKGNFTINKVEAKKYLLSDLFIMNALAPLTLLEKKGDYDIIVTVRGGGLSGQAGAISLGIARALVEVDAAYREKLKPAGLLTRDARSVERKKPGLNKARRSRQYSKR